MAHPWPQPTMVSFQVSPLGLPVLLMLVAQPWLTDFLASGISVVTALKNLLPPWSSAG